MQILSSNRGIALLMVMSLLVVLTVVLATFTYDTQLNILRMSNIQEKLQARLNAESGLNFAMAQLRIYQAANNKVAKNKSLQSFANPYRLEEAVTSVSLIYPVEFPEEDGEEEVEEDDLMQRSAKERFNSNNFLQGGINVSIQSIKGFLNPNRLIIYPKEDKLPKNPPKNPEEEKKRPVSLIAKEEMIKTLDNLLTSKRESDEEFDKEYGDMDPEFMIKELSWYVNHPDHFDDPEKGRIEELYAREGATPKHAPLTSLEELYLLQGWPDAIVDMVKDSFTVHENHSIPINEIVQSQLESLFPELEPEQVEHFFHYRDGDPEQEWDPSPFQNVNHFRSFMVDQLDIGEKLYERRAEELERAKMKFGVVGKLYKIVSRGNFNRVDYTLTAFVEIPVEPPKKKKSNPLLSRRQRQRNAPKPPAPKKKEGPEILQPPKIVEIRIQ